MPGRHDDLKRALRAARSQAGYESDNALAVAAGVHLQTLQNWMYGKTTPRPSELSKVALVLDKPMDYFMAIYEGREPESTPLHETVADLTSAVRDLVTEIRQERQSRGATFRRELAELGEALDEAVPASPSPARRPALRGDGG